MGLFDFIKRKLFGKSKKVEEAKKSEKDSKKIVSKSPEKVEKPTVLQILKKKGVDLNYQCVEGYCGSCACPKPVEGVIKNKEGYDDSNIIGYYNKDEEILACISKIDVSKIKFDTYDSVTIHYMKNDRKMEIVALSGIALYPNNLEKCLKKRDEIVKEIKNALNNPREDEYISRYGEGNDNIGYTKEFIIKNGSIKAWCSDWDENTEKEDNWQDDLTISVASEEFLFWVDNKAY